MKNHLFSSRHRLSADLLSKILFCFCVILSIVTTYYVSGHFLDSDASSELVLAKQLSETGQILSRDWIYSTELRVLNTQLVYAPLFRVFDDWQMVRFAGALILQAIYILSYSFMLHQGGFSRTDFYLSASLLLLPVSTAYGRIMLYHCYYIPHIALSFFLTGIFLGFSGDKELSPVKSGIRLAVMLLFSFIGGLGGIRQLMITHAPMLLLIVLLCLAEDLKSSENSKAAIFSRQKILLLTVAALALLAAFLGYKVNTGILSRYYIFRSYNETNLGILDFSNMKHVLYGFLHQFGFRKDISMLSLLGILSLGGILAAGFCLCFSVRILCSHKAVRDLRKTIVFLFFLCYWIVMTAVFFITQSPDGYYYPLYYVMCLPWAVALLLSVPSHFPSSIHPFNFKRIFSWAAVLILFANGFANALFFNGSERMDQVYDGLGFQTKDKAAQMEELTAYLISNGYDAGYASHWECNIITEITDGQLPMTNLMARMEPDGSIYIHRYYWLTSLWQMEAPKEKPFFILETHQLDAFEESIHSQYCTLVYSDDFHCAFSIDDLDGFVSGLPYA